MTIIHFQTGKVAAIKWEKEKENHKEEKSRKKMKPFTDYLGKCSMGINSIKLGSVSKSSHKLNWSLKIEVLSHSAFTNC